MIKNSRVRGGKYIAFIVLNNTLHMYVNVKGTDILVYMQTCWNACGWLVRLGKCATRATTQHVTMLGSPG